MSQQACAEFIAQINADTTLRQEVETFLEGKEDNIAAASLAFVQLGTKYGYEFTKEEAIQVYQEVSSAVDGELNDSALESAAGGVLPTLVPTTIYKPIIPITTTVCNPTITKW